MTLIDKVVSNMFGYSRDEKDIQSFEFMKQCIKNAPNTVSQYYDKTPNQLINEFLFEQTDIAKQLKEIMEKVNDSPEEENT